jgi:LmbE family N-acetylglucosaminyl deacetylase
MIQFAPRIARESSAHSAELLNRLCGRGERPRVLILMAHPDDEVIGAGVRLRWLEENTTIVLVTDGAPADMRDALQAGFRSAEHYADARRHELFAALRLVGVSEQQTSQLGFKDQAVVQHIPALTEQVTAMLTRHRPELVLTHPYEGGHPDHDAIALACSIAAEQRNTPRFEMTSYHLGPEGLHSGDFLPSNMLRRFLSLTPEERAFKQKLFNCFRTQQHVLRWFRTDVEAFRVAPEYDFTQPPHPGTLFYEQFKIGMTWHEWRTHADAVLQQPAFA